MRAGGKAAANRRIALLPYDMFPALTSAGAHDDGSGSAVPPVPLRLSETGLYANGSPTEVEDHPRNAAFSPQYVLWSDGADKRRWLHTSRERAIDASRPTLPETLSCIVAALPMECACAHQGDNEVSKP